MAHQPISWALAFLAGLVSFVSPCVLPIVPSYVSYITGLSFEELTGQSQVISRKTILRESLLHSLVFSLGFSTLFIGFGASASFLGEVLLTYQDVIRKLGAILIILFGLLIAGWLRIPFLSREIHMPFFGKKATLSGSFLVGIGFAAGWTPCVGPILGAILFYAGSQGTVMKGVLLLSFYSLGLAIPFILASSLLNLFLGSMRSVRQWMPWITRISGGFLVVMGVLIFTNAFTILSAFLTQHHIGWTPNL
ncbi:MAG: cytochrome c biogenesis protein CcdA [Nitrospirota bacterium]|nr:cytochrome c biogenesis protein CcdA [Nitrospirota bacterium]